MARPRTDDTLGYTLGGADAGSFTIIQADDRQMVNHDPR